MIEHVLVVEPKINIVDVDRGAFVGDAHQIVVLRNYINHFVSSRFSNRDTPQREQPKRIWKIKIKFQ